MLPVIVPNIKKLIMLKKNFNSLIISYLRFAHFNRGNFFGGIIYMRFKMVSMYKNLVLMYGLPKYWVGSHLRVFPTPPLATD